MEFYPRRRCDIKTIKEFIQIEGERLFRREDNNTFVSDKNEATEEIINFLFNKSQFYIDEYKRKNAKVKSRPRFKGKRFSFEYKRFRREFCSLESKIL